MHELPLRHFLHEEVRNVSPADLIGAPLGRVEEGAVAARRRAVRQETGANDGPVEAALADDLLLHVLVVIDAASRRAERPLHRKEDHHDRDCRLHRGRLLRSTASRP